MAGLDIASLIAQLDSGANPFAPSEQDRKDAMTRALMTAGMAMLAGNRSSNPWPAIGMGGLAGMREHGDALSGAGEQKQKALMLRQQLAQLMRQEKDYERQDKSRSGINAARQAATTAPGMTQVAGGTGFDDEGNAMPNVDMPTPGGFDASRFAQQVMQNPDVDIEKAMAISGAVSKQQGWKKIGKAPGGGDLYIGPDGKPEVVGKQGENWVPLREMDGGLLMQETGTGKMDWVGMKGTRVSANAYGGAGGKVAEGLDKGAGEYVYKEVMPKVTAAREANAVLESMRRNVGVTGFFSPMNITFKQGLVALGLGGENAKVYAAKGENFTADASALVLSEQMKQKGPQTESDAKRLQMSLPDVQKSPLGNEYLIRVRMAQNNRTIAYYNFIGKLISNRNNPVNVLEADLMWEQSPEGKRSIFEDPLLRGFSLDPRGGQGTIGAIPEVSVGRRIN